MVPPLLPDTLFAQSLTTHPPTTETPITTSTIQHLSLTPHQEGGYFVETDRSPLLIPNPFNTPTNPPGPAADHDSTRNASTTIYYLLTPCSPVGHFHRNKARTVHTLHRGRGRYLLIHEDGRVETFLVGENLGRGERLQWVVEGGIWKASYLLPDVEGGRVESKGGLLISETVVPGFEFRDHEFMTGEGLRGLVGERAAELSWLSKRGRGNVLSACRCVAVSTSWNLRLGFAECAFERTPSKLAMDRAKGTSRIPVSRLTAP